MNKFSQLMKWTAGAVLLASALGIGVFGIAAAALDEGTYDDQRSEHEYDDHDSDDDSDERGGGYPKFSLDHGRPANAAYQEECGACHVPYPPGLLPSASWHAIMAGLDDHFGDNAELPNDTRVRIDEFLNANAVDRDDRLKSARLLRGVGDNAPLRITELPYFRRRHGEIPRRMVEDNPKVQSLSRCDACHRDAAKGHFDEDHAAIPGFSRWDD